MDTFLWVCNDLGVLIANEKTVQPTKVLIVFGIEFHTVEMIMKLPIEKIHEIKQKITEAMKLDKATLKQFNHY